MYLSSFCVWMTRLNESTSVINSSIHLHQSRNDTCVEGRRFTASKEPIHTSGCLKACRTDQIPQWTRSPLSQKVFGSLHIMNVRRTCLSSSVTNLSYAWFTWLESPSSLTSRIFASQRCWHILQESLGANQNHQRSSSPTNPYSLWRKACFSIRGWHWVSFQANTCRSGRHSLSCIFQILQNNYSQGASLC